jgi:hypothetical protein
MDKKKMVTPGICPWCQNAVKTGAAACASCGASEIDGWQSFGAMRYFIWAIFASFLAVPGIVLVFVYPAVGIPLLLVGLGVPIAIQMSVKSKRNWIAPGFRARI